MGGVIHRKDLDRLFYWLGNVLGIGPGIGDVFFVASSGSAYETWFKKMGVDSNHLKATIALAYAATTTLRNDVVCVAPEIDTATAELDWTKSHTHLVGLGGPNVQGRYGPSGTSPIMGNAMLYTVTAAVGSTLHVAGYRNQFHNMQFVNGYNGATNYDAVRIGNTLNLSYGNYFKNCMIQGIYGTSCNTTKNSSLRISLGSSYYMFEGCHIGQNTYGGDRATSYQGHLFYPGTADIDAVTVSGGYGPQNGMFKDCFFYSRSSASVYTPVAVRIGGYTSDDHPTGDEAMDRVHWFVNCHFDSWAGVGSTKMTSVFDDNSLSYHSIRLVNCTAHRYDQWRAVRASQNAAGINIYSAGGMPTGLAAHPGEGYEPTS